MKPFHFQFPFPRLKLLNILWEAHSSFDFFKVFIAVSIYFACVFTCTHVREHTGTVEVRGHLWESVPSLQLVGPRESNLGH